MEKLEKKIIEIRENIDFLGERMNETYSFYESSKDKREDAEVNLEILNDQKKDISYKIFSKQFSKISLVVIPLNFVLFGYLFIINLNFELFSFVECFIFIVSSLFLSLISGLLISFFVLHLLRFITSSDILFINIDNDIKKLKKEYKVIEKKIKNTSKLLHKHKINEKEYAELYSNLCTKYNSSKDLLDEIEGIYFDKTKNIINELKTYNLYSILNSLSDDDREYIVDCIKNIFLNYPKKKEDF